jgi:hypothetical protein
MRKNCGPDIQIIFPRNFTDFRREITYQGIHKYQIISNLIILVSRLLFSARVQFQNIFPSTLLLHSIHVYLKLYMQLQIAIVYLSVFMQNVARVALPGQEAARSLERSGSCDDINYVLFFFW